MRSVSETDTIAAISTAPGLAGISVVRASGPGSLAIADRIFQGPGVLPSARAGGTFVHGFVRSPATGGADDGVADEVVLLIFRAPRSYTREDVIEFQGHGGRVAAQRVLRCVLNNGARAAEPGEFTRRAFLNGRLDLTQCEAVLDLIRAQTELAAAAAIEQLTGRLTSSLKSIYDDLLHAAASLEASLDFPEDDVPDGLIGSAAERLRAAAGKTAELIATWGEGRLLREGYRVVIAGAPNVGKSTLLNALLMEERAIVSDAPGTTRDTIEETIVIDGFPVRLVDTAGLRHTECRVERQGVERSRQMIETADLVLYVVDGSAPISGSDRQTVDSINKNSIILIINKIDISRTTRLSDYNGVAGVECSMLSDSGRRAVVNAIGTKLSSMVAAEPHAVVGERHYRQLRAARDFIVSAMHDIQSGHDYLHVAVATQIRSAMDAIDMITGRSCPDDVLDAVFSRFCIGK